MTTTGSEFLKAVTERGFIHQCTDVPALDKLASEGPIHAYIGFDATADSLHAGSLVPIMLLRLLQRTGHKPIVLMGGGTTKVGDPSGKDEQRQLLDDARIEANIQGIRRIFENFLTFGDGPSDALRVAGLSVVFAAKPLTAASPVTKTTDASTALTTSETSTERSRLMTGLPNRDSVRHHRIRGCESAAGLYHRG